MKYIELRMWNQASYDPCSYFISHPQFNIWNIPCIISHSFLAGSLEPTNDWLPTSDEVSGFIAQSVRASHQHREVTGSNPVEILNFSGFYMQLY